MVYYPSELSYVGVAKEAMVGTAVAPVSYLRCNGISSSSLPAILTDQSWRGSVARDYDQRAGVMATGFDLQGNVYPDEIGWLFASLLNDVAVTGASDPYATTFALLNSGAQPGTFTLTDFNGNAAHAYAGLMVSTMTVTVQDGFATFTATLAGLSKAVAATPTLSISATRAMPAFAATVSLGGSSAAKVTGYTVTIARTVNVQASLHGTNTPDIITAGGDLNVSGTLNAIYDSGQGPTIDGYLEGATKVALVTDLVDPATANREVKFQTSEVVLTGTLQRASATLSTLQCTWVADANPTDVGSSGGLSPIKITTKSASPSGTYK